MNLLSMNDTIPFQYHLEKSEMTTDQPCYVLGKSFPNGNAEIQPYGAVLSHYTQMKTDVMNDLRSQGPPPIMLLTKPTLQR